MLSERRLAASLRVSRTPLRLALAGLERRGLVVRGANRRLQVVDDPQDAGETGESPPPDDLAYERLARDRLADLLPGRVTERQLAERYTLPAPAVRRLVQRVAREGWITRRPGYGWEFTPLLTSLEGYAQAYRFRLIVEPAALLEPSYAPDANAVARCRDQQLRLVDGDIWRVSAATVFDANRRLHEVIAAGAHNEVLLTSLRRVNDVRRLIEYQQALPRARARERCLEHVHLAELVLAGDFAGASASLRRHLTDLGVEKVEPRPGPSVGQAGDRGRDRHGDRKREVDEEEADDQ